MGPTALHERVQSAFVPMMRWHRWALLLYVMLYRVWDPFFDFMMVGGAEGYGTRILAAATYDLLVFAPAILYGERLGWLHPLVFLPVYTLAKKFAADPMQLFQLVTVPEQPFVYEVANIALLGAHSGDVLTYEVYADLILILGIVFYYMGYLVLGRYVRPTRMTLYPPQRVALVCASVMGIALVFFLVYMQMRGGILAHINTIYASGAGRYNNLKSVRFLSVLVQFGTLAWLLWYALRPHILRNPLYIASGLLFMGFNFISTGSRSSALFVLIMLVMIVLLRKNAMKVGRVAVVGVVVLLGLTTLREVRMLAWHGDFDLGEFRDTVTADGFLGNIEKGRAEMTDRSARTDGYLAVVSHVAEGGDLLWGESYLHIVFAPIPRVLWEGKPRSIDAYVGTRLYGYDGISIPCGIAGEALYNFHIAGLVFVMLIFGVFHRWLAVTYVENRATKLAPFLYAITLFWFTPYSSTLVGFIQQTVPIVGMLVAMGVIRFREVLR